MKDNPLNQVQVEYVDYLPAYRFVGSHPQFTHCATPPDGYTFTTRTSSPASLSRNIRWVGSLATIPFRTQSLRSIGRCLRILHRHRASPKDISGFLRTRRGQFLLPEKINLAFLPSYPFLCNQVPWVIEIEDPITLFCPFIKNGATATIDFPSLPAYHLVKYLLEHDQCRGIISHIEATSRGLPKLFNNPDLSQKISHIPMGFALPEDLTLRSSGSNDRFTMLFTNSWHQNPDSFYLRGGLDLLTAFHRLKRTDKRLHLVLRTKLPGNLPLSFRRMIATDSVELIDFFLPRRAMDELIARTDCFVLPSARIHVVSLLEAMARGLAVVTSDGWGIEEYIEHGRTGMIVKGRYGKCSWQDDRAGVLREDYRSLYFVDRNFTNGLVTTLRQVIEDRQLRLSLGEQAKDRVLNHFSIARWNEGLKSAFNRAVLDR